MDRRVGEGGFVNAYVFFSFFSLRISVGLRSGTWTRTGVRNPMPLRHFNVRVSHSTYKCHISKRIPIATNEKKKKKRASRYGSTLCGTCRCGLGPLQQTPTRTSVFFFENPRGVSAWQSGRVLKKPHPTARTRARRKPRTALQGHFS